MTTIHGDSEAILEIVELGTAVRLRVERPGMLASSVVLRGDELVRFKGYVAVIPEYPSPPHKEAA